MNDAMKKSFLIMMTAALLSAAGCTPHNEKSCKDMENATLQKIDPKELDGNVIKMFDDDWMVVSAGNAESMNLMTVSWGGLGMLWNKPVATIYVAPQRYTHQFLEREEYYTICHFDSTYRDRQAYLGSTSGRDEDKVEGSGLTVRFTDLGNPIYEEADLAIECRKIYTDHFHRESLQQEQLDWYEDRGIDPHGLFIGEIVNVFVRRAQ